MNASFRQNIGTPIHEVNRKSFLNDYKNAYSLYGMEFKDRLIKARKAAKRTQKQVAEAVGISQPTYSDMETGNSASSSYIVEIAAFLGVSAQWLRNGEGLMQPGPENAVSEPAKIYKSPPLTENHKKALKIIDGLTPDETKTWLTFGENLIKARPPDIRKSEGGGRERLSGRKT